MAAYPPPPGTEEQPDRRVPGRRAAGFRRALVRLVALIPLALIVVEGVNTTPHAPVIPQPAALRGAEGPLLVLPSSGTLEFSVMLWSTDGFPKIVNGLAAFTPDSQAQTLGITASFPDRLSVDHLRQLGVRPVDAVAGGAEPAGRRLGRHPRGGRRLGGVPARLSPGPPPV
jgi:hypothetical protein